MEHEIAGHLGVPHCVAHLAAFVEGCLLPVVARALAGSLNYAHARLDHDRPRRLHRKPVQAVVAIEALTALDIVDDAAMCGCLTACVFDLAAFVDADGIGAAASAGHDADRCE
jgi:hypothetical protein